MAQSQHSKVWFTDLPDIACIQHALDVPEAEPLPLTFIYQYDSTSSLTSTPLQWRPLGMLHAYGAVRIWGEITTTKEQVSVDTLAGEMLERSLRGGYKHFIVHAVPLTLGSYAGELWNGPQCPLQPQYD